jgi:vacuolar-type H+-ATPase subunit H
VSAHTNERRAGDWTIETYAIYNEALREADRRLQEERDRRYAEVKNAEEKALRVKEDADKTALGLQRENQQYKDEKANQLREQISSERGLYATKADVVAAVEKVQASIAPLISFVAGQQGRSTGQTTMWGWIIAGISVGILVINFFTKH